MAFQSIQYDRVLSADEDDSELPPTFVSTRGSERNGRWNHIENLDDFFIRIYHYFHHSGFACLMLSEVLELVQYVFIVLFTTFLFICVDYKELFDNPHPEFSNVIDWKKFESMPMGLVICLLVALLFWIMRLGNVIRHALKAWEIRQFYSQALHVRDSDLQNMQWQDIQQKLIDVQKVLNMCIHKQELTELDIHHRILRQKNYLIAMHNKGVLSCLFKFPMIGERTFLTEGLKYNIRLILFNGPGAPFECSWKIRPEFKDHSARITLASRLSHRIFLLGVINLALCPFIFIYQVLYSFFTYAELVKRSPDTFGARKWSLYGRLYLRHFNELDHEFHARLSKAYDPSQKYMNSFTSPILTIVCRNIAFFAGSVLAVMLGLSFYDKDVLTAEHVISFMALLGIIIKICAGFIPDEHLVWHPETLLKQILAHTHYIPDHWKGKAHTTEVREQFSRLFQYKFVNLVEELMSPLLTPFILCFAVRYQSLQIVDFLRNFTVDVTGVGDVCSFAQMDVRRHGNKEWNVSSAVVDVDYDRQAEHGKTELSLLHFSIKNPTWKPTDSGKQLIETIKEQALSESLTMSGSLRLGLHSHDGMIGSFSRDNDFTNFIGLPLPSLPCPEGETGYDQLQREALMKTSIVYMHEAHNRWRQVSGGATSLTEAQYSEESARTSLGLERTWPDVQTARGVAESQL